MGKKKKGKKKGGKKAKGGGGPIAERVHILPQAVEEVKNLQPEELQLMRKRLGADLEAQLKRRNRCQLERDTMQTFFDITKQQVRTLELEIEAEERIKEKLEENHAIEIKVYVQKAKELQYRHKSLEKKVSEEATAEKEAESASSVERIEEIEGKKTELRATLSNLQLSQMKDIEEIRAKAKKVIHTLRSRFEDNLEDLNERYREKIVRLESNLQLRRKVETHEIEERKNKHINELIANHERAFKEMKDYYNDITRYNLKAIKQHKEELVQLREKNEKNHGHLVEFRDKNRDLEAPLRKALVEVEQLRHRLKNRAKDQLSLEYATARLQLVKGKVAKLRSEKDALEERFRRVEAERDQIYEGFEGTVQRIERQGELRNVVMERQIDLKDKQLQERTVALQTVVREARQHPEMLKIRPDEKGGIRKEALAAHLVGVCGDGQAIAPALREHLQAVTGPSVGVGPMVNAVAGSIQKALDGRAAEIDTLQFEVVRVVSEYNRMQRTLHAKLGELAMAQDQLPPLDIIPMPSFDAADGRLAAPPAAMSAHSTARVDFGTFQRAVSSSPWAQ